MGYDIQITKLNEIRSELFSVMDEWSNELQQVGKAIIRIIETDNMKGEGADRIRLYLDEVSLEIKRGMRRLLASYKYEVSNYVNGYKQIDNSDHAHFAESALSEKESLCKRIIKRVSDSDLQIHKITDNVNDLVQVQKSEDAILTESFQVAMKRIKQTNDDVSEYETFKAASKTETAIEELRYLLHECSLMNKNILSYNKGEFNELRSFLKSYPEFVSAGLTKSDVTRLKTLFGYTDDELKGYIEVCKTEEDFDVIKYLAGGTKEDYEKLFALEPDRISNEIWLMITEYTTRIISFDEKGNCNDTARLEDFDNALLNAITLCEDNNSLQHREVFLEKIAQFSRSLYSADALMLALTDVGNDQYETLQNEYLTRRAMANFWGTEQKFFDSIFSADSPLGTSSYKEQHISVDNIQFQRYDAESIKLQFYSPNDARILTYELKGQFVSGTGLYDASDKKTAQEAGKKMDNAIASFILNMIGTGLNSFITVEFPELGMLFELVEGVKNNKFVTLSAFTTAIKESVSQKWGAKINTSFVKALNALISMEKLLSNRSTDKTIMYKWFGAGCEYHYSEQGSELSWLSETYFEGDQVYAADGIAFSGFYDPEKLYKAEQWNLNGLEWVDWGEESWDDVKERYRMLLENIKQKDITLYEDCYKLIYGGFESMEESNRSIIFEGMTAERFETAIDWIETQMGAGFSIHEQFITS